VAVEDGTGRLLGEPAVEARQHGFIKLLRFAERHTNTGGCGRSRTAGTCPAAWSGSCRVPGIR